MSFSHGDYERTFRLALHAYRNSHQSAIKQLAIEIMDACELMIGRMPHRPRRSRRERGWNLIPLEPTHAQSPDAN